MLRLGQVVPDSLLVRQVSSANSSRPVSQQTQIVEVKSPTKSPASKEGFFERAWSWIKSLFGSKSQVQQNLKVPYTFRPQIILQEGFLDLDFVMNNSKDCIFVFAGAKPPYDRQGGRFGEIVTLRQAQQLIPDSVFELPVSKRAASDNDPIKLKVNALSDDELESNLEAMSKVFDAVIAAAYRENKKIVFRKVGYGTGLSGLCHYAPKTFEGLNNLLESKFGLRHILVDGKYKLCPSGEIPKQKRSSEKPQHLRSLWEGVNSEHALEAHQMIDRMHRRHQTEKPLEKPLTV